MTENQHPDQEPWEARANLAPGTTRITLSCQKEERNQWSEEARDEGFSSRSKYLYQLIQEARAYRQHGLFADQGSKQRIEELETQVEALEQQVERERRKQSGRITVDDPLFLEQFLTETYTPLPELLQMIVESGTLDDLLRKRIEDQLYVLAAQNQVEYEPGWGWRLRPETTMENTEVDNGG